MATFKIKGQVNIVFDNLEVEADSEEEALNKLYRMDGREIIDNAIIEDVETVDEEAELTEGTFQVHVKSVDYAVEFNDCWDIVVDENPGIDEDSDEFDNLVYAKIEEIKKSLPQELDLEITCYKEDLEDYVADAISQETDWLINGAEFDIKSVK